MKELKAKKKKEKAQDIQEDDRVFYIDSNIPDYEFSDFVRLQSFPRGIMLSFGKWFPGLEKFGIFKEILLPFDIVSSLGKMINDHIEKLIKDGYLKVHKEEEEEKINK